MGMKKQLIINTDDFGISDSVNNAVSEAFKNGILTSASLMANAPSFENAVKLLEELPSLSVGVHLNVVEFSTLLQNLNPDSLLYDKNGKYNNGFLQLLLKSYNKTFLEELEQDFRLQIEKIKNVAKITHIDSHVHVHAIPNIFKLVCKLAKEYNINNIRTQFEYPYLVSDIKKIFSLKYPINLVKVLLLNCFTLINCVNINRYGLDTNNNIIGVNYTGCMDKNSICSALKNTTKLTELLLHPSTNPEEISHYNEFLALIDDNLRNKIEQLNVSLVNWDNYNL